MTNFIAPLLLITFVSHCCLAANGDPMRPPYANHMQQHTAISTKQRFEVQQIKTGTAGPSAIINGKLVREGDVVLGARVVDIAADAVVIKYRQKLKTLSLLINTKSSGE